MAKFIMRDDKPYFIVPYSEYMSLVYDNVMEYNIVHCCNCKYAKLDSSYMYICTREDNQNPNGYFPDDFCSRGIRRKEHNND